MPKAFRIVKSRYARRAFDGEGARIYGGRWNSPQKAVVYTAGSRALAILEMLVHLQSSSVLSSYSLCAAFFEEGLIERLDRSKLPEGWRRYPAPTGLRSIGDAWIERQGSVVLEVPSVIVEEESNYLLNPHHPEFASVQLGEPEPFELDQRLV